MLTRSRTSVFKTSPLDNERDLLGWWTFDGAAVDISGRQNNTITLTGSPGVTSTIFGGALRLNGSSQYIDVGTIQSFAFPITFAAWINVAGAGGSGGNGIFGGGFGSVGFRVSASDSKLHLLKENFVDLGSSTGTITTGRDTHVAASYDGTNLAFYINGVASGTATNAPGGFVTTPTVIGAGTIGGVVDYFNGTIADARAYRRILSEAEINAIYNQGIARLSLSPDEWEMPALSAVAAAQAYAAFSTPQHDGQSLTQMTGY